LRVARRLGRGTIGDPSPDRSKFDDALETDRAVCGRVVEFQAMAGEIRELLRDWALDLHLDRATADSRKVTPVSRASTDIGDFALLLI
jgi:hypothetical protein